MTEVLTEKTSVKSDWIDFIDKLQDDICEALEKVDGGATFREDKWTRAAGGGGKTRVIANGKVFEKGGVNTSVVFGEVGAVMRNQLRIKGNSWFACGLSLVVHPINPFVPTIHCNYRMFEVYDEQNCVIDRWFGGGTDLTPYYLFDEDAISFHSTHKKKLDGFDSSLYAQFKSACDTYFTNTHRDNERRGIGGIFYDHQRPDEDKNVTFWMNLAQACGYAFIESYIPIVERRKEMPFNEGHKFWQEVRRGRYTEFNLLHDRGTIFGLKTNGRTESILMSLPPTVRFEYDYHPLPGSDEEELLEVCLHPREWI